MMHPSFTGHMLDDRQLTAQLQHLVAGQPSKKRRETGELAQQHDRGDPMIRRGRRRTSRTPSAPVNRVDRVVMSVVLSYSMCW
jgi:hypothetical protein